MLYQGTPSGALQIQFGKGGFSRCGYTAAAPSPLTPPGDVTAVHACAWPSKSATAPRRRSQRTQHSQWQKRLPGSGSMSPQQLAQRAYWEGLRPPLAELSPAEPARLQWQSL